jgi:hypothetical protein
MIKGEGFKIHPRTRYTRSFVIFSSKVVSITSSNMRAMIVLLPPPLLLLLETERSSAERVPAE